MMTGWAGPFARSVNERRVAQRALGLTLVALLHLLLLLALLQAVTATRRTPLPGRETILRLIPLLKPAPPASAPQSQNTPVLRRAVTPPMPTPVPLPAAPDLRPPGNALFDCTPEALANLPPGQRARCDVGALVRPDDSVVTEPKSRVKDPVRRAAEMAAKNTPGRIPCTGFVTAHTPKGDVTAPAVSPLCVLKGLVTGFGPLNGLEK